MLIVRGTKIKHVFLLCSSVRKMQSEKDFCYSNTYLNCTLPVLVILLTEHFNLRFCPPDSIQSTQDRCDWPYFGLCLAGVTL